MPGSGKSDNAKNDVSEDDSSFVFFDGRYMGLQCIILKFYFHFRNDQHHLR